MKLPPLPPYEEFMKLNNNSEFTEENNTPENIQETLIEAFSHEVKKMCLYYLECYHNWLSKQLEDNVQSAETDAE